MTRNLKILLLVLIIILLGFGAFIFYYSFQSKSPPLEEPNQNELTEAERNQALTELRQISSKSPPLTDKERAQALVELRKTIASQK